MPTEKQYTVLLIDDSPDDRATYCRYLQHGSSDAYQVLEAGSAAVGLDLYQRLLPDAVLLDYLLPDMDGLECLALMQSAGKQRVPILMLTGQGDETIAAQAIKQGAQDYLIKGTLTADGLCKAVEHAIEQWQLQQRLQRQEQQQQILNAIALRIRQALTLQTILDTSVAEVRQYLSADRVVIYQFAPDMSGQIVAEAVLPEWIDSLHTQIEDTCFREKLGGDYQLGRIRAIADIHAAGLTDCHIQLLERFQVKANLVVPLLITDQHSDSTAPHHDAALPQLWGLLVAHQCAATRQWQPFETDLLNQVAVQMAIAIQQAELYRQLQNELAERQETVQSLQASTAALALSEQRYRSLVAATTQAIWTADPEGKTTEAIPGWRALTGQTEAEASGWQWMDAIHPDDRAKTVEAWRIATATKQLYEVEHRVRTADGSYKIFMGRAAPVLDETGNIREWIGAHTDISDRKQAAASLQQLNQELETRVQERAAKLRASEARLREAQRIAHVGDWEFALASQTITWSEELFRLFECDPVQGEPEYAEHLQSYVPESRLQLEHAVQQAATLGTPYELELQFSRTHDSVRWLLARGEAVRDVDGAIVKLLGTALDITDRKQAEAQLSHLSNRLTLAVKSGAIAIWDWNVTENILTWDDRMYELYGITPNQFTSVYDAWANSVHPDDRPLAEAAIPSALAGEKDYDVEFRVIHPDGTIRFLKAYALMERDEQGELKQMVGINYDITEHKQIEQALQQLTLDLQRSNQELEQFAYVASHDLQEPLRAITSYTQLLAKRYQGQLDEKADKYIYYVVDGATRMQQLIQDLLAYSRVGKYELKQQPTDCNAVLQQVQKDLQAAIAESNAILTIDPLPTIFADTVQMMQLFQNLVGNALKYRGDAPPMIRVSARQQSKAWVFSIQDNGIGIEPQYAERIFEIFQRLHTRREYQGTGLGLAICKKIVERHHGHLWVESQLGQGALFCFTLPALLDG